jgi:hypothetical protein
LSRHTALFVEFLAELDNPTGELERPDPDVVAGFECFVRVVHTQRWSTACAERETCGNRSKRTDLTTSARQKLQPLQAISIAESARPSFEIVTFQL